VLRCNKPSGWQLNPTAAQCDSTGVLLICICTAAVTKSLLITTCPHSLSLLCYAAGQVWIVDDGKITFYNGDFDDYRNELVKEINAELDEDEE
jgi:hypothetical protein